jgi:hypothetical protein
LEIDVRLTQVLSIVLTQFSVGTLLLTALLPAHEIRAGFFKLNSLLSALTAAVALVLIRFGEGSGWVEVRFLGLTVIGATVAYGCYRLERGEWGRVLLIVSGLLGLMFGLLPLAGRALAARGLVASANARFYFDASLVAGTLLMGATNVGMILGHWYLLMRRLSFEYLRNFTFLLLGAVGLRAAVILITISTLGNADPRLASQLLPNLGNFAGNGAFFALRLFFGIVGPAVLGYMTRCVREEANQAATGLLYICEVSVLFGELFAAYLLI